MVVLMVAAGCGSEPEATPEQRVSERAIQRWQALIARDIGEAYEFLSPAYRQAVSLDRYKSSIGGAVAWQDVEVKRVECKQDLCDVSLMIRYKYKNNTVAADFESSTVLEEKWVLSDGDWWYFQKL